MWKQNVFLRLCLEEGKRRIGRILSPLLLFIMPLTSSSSKGAHIGERSLDFLVLSVIPRSVGLGWFRWGPGWYSSLESGSPGDSLAYLFQ